MNGLIEVCCGVEEEPVKSNRFFYYDDDHQGASDNVARGGLTKFLQRWSPRGKAMIALSLKNDRRSIFSSPVLKVEDARTYQCPCYQKTPQEIDFLKTTLKKHILFEELTEEELDDLVRATKKESADAGRKIVTQDELGEHMYIVQSGYLSFYCEETKQRCGTLQRGDVYGEADLLFGVKVPKTIMVDQPSVVWRLGQKCYRSVLSQHAMIADSDIKAALRKVKIFKNLPDPTINKFADSLTRVTYKKGDRIINKGEIGNIFYLIENGCVRVHDIGMGDSQQVDQILKAGESFGELALMTGEPRAANVTVESDSVTVLAMDRPTFNDSMGQLSDILDFSNRLQALRSLSIFATSSLTEVELERLAEKIIEVCYKQGTKLVKAGSPYPPCLWMFRSGKVIVYGTKSDHIYNMRAGDYFGDKSILNPKEHISSHDATCETNVDAYLLTRDDVESVIVDLGRLGRSTGFALSRRISTIGKGDLKVHTVLGQGGFGKVWLCTHRNDGSRLALKVINKRKLLQEKQEKGVLREKEILSMLHHPFILGLESSFQDEKNLYLVLPLIQGGELFHVVAKKAGRNRGIPKFDAAFYAAGIIEALGHFHHRYIAYRDLKLENVMIDADGYIKIVDLGFAKIVLDKSYTFCGTPDYLAPEIITAKGHNHTVDYWSYGVLLYELLTGRSPFSRPGLPHIKLFQRIVLLKYSFPLFMDPAGQDLIQRLLVRNATKRLGSQKNGYVDVRNHPFFHDAGIDDPKRLLKREITPPWIPVNDSKNNNRNNHGMMMMMDATDCNDFKKIERDDFSLSGPPLTAKEQELFNDF